MSHPMRRQPRWVDNHSLVQDEYHDATRVCRPAYLVTSLRISLRIHRLEVEPRACFKGKPGLLSSRAFPSRSREATQTFIIDTPRLKVNIILIHLRLKRYLHLRGKL